jgi:hypothetical protein
MAFERMPISPRSWNLTLVDSMKHGGGCMRAPLLALWAWCFAASAHATNVLGYPDFNGDGKSDLVWRDSNSSLAAVWLMNGTNRTAEAAIHYADGFSLECTGADFDGNGRSDFSWQLATRLSQEGAGVLALVDGVTVTQTKSFQGVVGATPDLDGDGKSDLALVTFWSGPRTLTLHLMDGLTPTATQRYTIDFDWMTSRVAAKTPVDFDGDGKGDLMFIGDIVFKPFTQDGRVAVWLMDGLAVKSAAVIMGATTWRVTHAADFDGDGKTDLLWRNGSAGPPAMWLMDGIAARRAELVYADAAWTVTHVGDFDGDGRADLLWRNESTGATAMWLMDGLVAKSAAFLFHDPEWSVATLGDYNGDGKADLVWRHLSGRFAAIWLMDGATAIDARVFDADPNWLPE